MLLEILNRDNTYLMGQEHWKTIAFADPIKGMLRELGLTLADIEAYKTKIHPVLGKTTRELMQTLGTEWGRNHGEDFWINVLKNKLERPNNYIISDVRFKNEAEFIRESNGLMIHVIGRGGLPGFHASEQLLPMHENEIILDNSGSASELYRNIQIAVKKKINPSYDYSFIYGGL